MKRSILGLTVALALVLLAMSVRTSHAEPRTAPRATGYELSWYTTDGGGAMNVQGGVYALSGTIGQHDAGKQSGGSYQLSGGFWRMLDSLPSVFLPLLRR